MCKLQFEYNHKTPSLFSISSASLARQNICVKLFNHILLAYKMSSTEFYSENTAQDEVVYASRRPLLPSPWLLLAPLVEMMLLACVHM